MGLNGPTVIQVSDTMHTAGAVALDVSNQPIGFDDVTVSTLPGPPPLFADGFSGGLTGWTLSPLLFSNWSSTAWIYPGQGKIKLFRNSVWHIDTPPGSQVTFTTERIKGISYAVFPASTGSWVAT